MKKARKLERENETFCGLFQWIKHHVVKYVYFDGEVYGDCFGSAMDEGCGESSKLCLVTVDVCLLVDS
jgi:hypothetical protein